MIVLKEKVDDEELKAAIGEVEPSKGDVEGEVSPQEELINRFQVLADYFANLDEVDDDYIAELLAKINEIIDSGVEDGKLDLSDYLETDENPEEPTVEDPTEIPEE